jgi:hypothetical protein
MELTEPANIEVEKTMEIIKVIVLNRLNFRWLSQINALTNDD